MPLTPKQERFVEEYLIDLNATQAAIRSGYSKKTAGSVGAENLTKPEIQAALSAAQNARSERTEITADMVLEQWWKLATADPNAIVSHRRVCCRFCHGKDHAYQWKASEYQAAMVEADTIAKDLGGEPAYPSDAGGYGFDPTVEPHPECPECQGEGRGEVHFADTRKLTGKAKALYAGAKQTSQGIEIKLRDQDKALELVAKHLGMFKDEINLGGNVTINVVKRG
ncbi:terminase small subunit [Rhizobium sp. YTU87027]|uniref:terminase small subunit n=1 Tax=Rhizobium sp. YTU87027 TaxID=3417741 RepID=UPI003D684185